MKLALVLVSFLAMAACTSAPVDEAHWNTKPQRQLSSDQETPEKPPSFYYNTQQKFF
ncbi:hypothetical protein D3C87_124300 [compost metagenome]